MNMKIGLCRFRKICNHYNKTSHTCNKDSGPYCGKYRELSQGPKKKKQGIPIEVKQLLWEVVNPC